MGLWVKKIHFKLIYYMMNVLVINKYLYILTHSFSLCGKYWQYIYALYTPHTHIRVKEMFFKFQHRLVTIDSEYLPQPTENRSSHRKNNIQRYNIPSCMTQYRQMSFFPRTIPEWNSLPQEIVAAKSLDCFKSRLAAHM